MPKAAPKKNGASLARQEPYTKSSPKDSASADKENVAPSSDNVSSAKPKLKSKSQDSSANEHHCNDYRAVPLDQVRGEVPCYDNAATVRRKLKSLLASKENIPDTSPAKKWSQAGMAAEMQKLEEIDGPVEQMNKNGNGPTARSLAIFLKKSGNMGGADSPCFYWGYVLLEKLRIMKGEKKSKPRVKAEEE